MDNNRVNKKVYMYFNSKSGIRCKNWQYEIKCFSNSIDQSDLFENCLALSSKLFVKKVTDKNMDIYVNEWKQQINAVTGRNGVCGNKLRTYKLFKQEFKTESYVNLLIPRQENIVHPLQK